MSSMDCTKEHQKELSNGAAGPVIAHLRSDVIDGETLDTRVTITDGNNGAFLVSSLKLKRRLQVICSDQEGWEHVSVSIHDRMPTWEEMNFIKNLFWDEDEYIEKEKADPRACSFSISARSTYIFSNL